VRGLIVRIRHCPQRGPEGGAGLGLSTVYGIIEESGGYILVDSKPNAGTKVTIYLPALPSRG